MKIIKGHDYYDSAAMYGIDKTIVYVRNEKEISDITIGALSDALYLRSDLGHQKLHIFTTGYRNQEIYPYEYKVLKVIIAGKLYVGVSFYVYKIYEDDEKHIFWDTKSFHDFFHKHLKDGYDYFGNNVFMSSCKLCKEGSKQLIDLGEFELPSGDINTLIENKITIASSNRYNNQNSADNYITEHTGLDDIQLYKILPATIIRQNIEQWVSGTLTGHDRPMIEVSDDVKKHKAGFDKWSFKKMGKKSK